MTEFWSFVCSNASCLTDVVAAPALPVIIWKYCPRPSFPFSSAWPNFTVSEVSCTCCFVKALLEIRALEKSDVAVFNPADNCEEMPPAPKLLLSAITCACNAFICALTAEKSPRATIFNSILAILLHPP
jgi:hypothetical protein